MERERVDGHIKQRPEVTNCWLEHVLFVQTKQERWCSGWFFNNAEPNSKVRRTTRRPIKSSSLQLKWRELDCSGPTNTRNKSMMPVKRLWLLMKYILCPSVQKPVVRRTQAERLRSASLTNNKTSPHKDISGIFYCYSTWKRRSRWRNDNSGKYGDVIKGRFVSATHKNFSNGDGIFQHVFAPCYTPCKKRRLKNWK